MADSELNIVLNAIDDTEEAFASVNEGLDSVGIAADEMATTFEESVAELNAAMATVDESAATMASEFDVAMAEMTVGSEAVAVSLSSMKSEALQAGIVAGIAFVALKDEIENASQAATKWNETMSNIAVELKNTGSSIPLSQIADYTAKLSSNTLFTQQDILASEALIFNHSELQSSYESITASAADLAQKTGDTLPQAMGILVKAFNDPITGMRQLQGAGLDFNATMVRTVTALTNGGDTAGAVAIIMQALKDQTNGLADSAARASGSGWSNLMKDLQTTQIVIGEQLNPALDEMAKLLDPIVVGIGKWAEAHPKLTAAILLGAAAVALLVVALAGLGIVISTVGISITAIGTLIGLVAASPIAILIAAFVAVGAAAVVMYNAIKNNWDGIKTEIENIANDVLSFVQDWYNKIMTWVNNILNSIGSIGKSIGGGISGAFNSVSNFVTTHLAEGGIVSSPTVALIGEAGPEAVIPLSMLGQGGSLSSGGGNGGINVYITGTIQSTADQAKQLGDAIAQQIGRTLRLQTYK